MTDGTALVAYCHQHPEDDTARLVYADWLEESGDTDRADFVRVQVARAKLPWYHPDQSQFAEREEQLRATNESRWKRELPNKYQQWVDFDRGLPTRLKLSADQFLKCGPEARQILHADSFALSGVAGKAKRIFKAEALEGVRHLELDFYPGGGSDVLALAQSHRLDALRSLTLRWSIFSDEVWDTLGHSDAVSRLKGAEALLSSGLLGRLQSLGCENNRISTVLQERLQNAVGVS